MILSFLSLCFNHNIFIIKTHKTINGEDRTMRLKYEEVIEVIHNHFHWQSIWYGFSILATLAVISLA